MGYWVELFPPEPCDYRVLTLPDDPSYVRLHAYRRPFIAPALRYRVSRRACLAGERLVGLEGWRRRPIAATLPFESPSVARELEIPRMPTVELARLRLRSWLPARRHFKGSLCSLLDLRAWQVSYFHWFIDCLPRVLAAEDHQSRSGRPVCLMVPDPMLSWQRDSLELLGWRGDRLVPFRPVNNQRHLAVDELISCSLRGAGEPGDAPSDAMVPSVIRCLRERFLAALPPDSSTGLPRRLYLSREDAPSRQVVNEREVTSFLGRYGFERIVLSRLSLVEQIALFQTATHIVAPHGAGLTNLVHARKASVLEFFQPEHQPRPDFLQIAAANGLHYDQRLGAAVGQEGDIRIAINDLASWRHLPA